jgi:ABC-2 type transport system ATP-binding protein
VVAEEVLQHLVSHVAREELTVFFSSHQLAEVDQIADRVAVIHRGRMVLTGALDDLRESFRRIQMVFDGQAPDVTFRAPGVLRVKREGRVLLVTTSGGADALDNEARALGAVSVEAHPITLKEMFLETVATED